MTGGGEGVDFFLADEEKDFVATSFEDLRDGDAGIEVTAGAAAGDEDGRGLFGGRRLGHAGIGGVGYIWGVQRDFLRITGS